MSTPGNAPPAPEVVQSNISGQVFGFGLGFIVILVRLYVNFSIQDV